MSAQSMAMVEANDSSQVGFNLGEWIGRAWRFNRTLTLATLINLALLPLVVLAMWLDPVVITGVNGWVKPLKFLISISVYTSTFLWFLMQVQGWRRLVQFTAWFVGVALLIENAIIIGQVMRGTTSHFNVGTALDAALFSTMGLLIFTIAFLNLLIAIRLVWQKMDNPVFAWALRLALLTTVAGMFVAALMTSPTADQLAQAEQSGAITVAGAHSVGLDDGGPGLPLVGWSTVGGDLRVPHFVGLHALQVIPLLGWLLTRKRTQQWWNERQRLGLIWLAGLGYFGLMGLLTWQALRGQSIVAPDGLTVAVFGGLLAAVVIPTLLVAGWRRTSGE